MLEHGPTSRTTLRSRAFRRDGDNESCRCFWKLCHAPARVVHEWMSCVVHLIRIRTR